jgi:hypothetical protein
LKIKFNEVSPDVFWISIKKSILWSQQKQWTSYSSFQLLTSVNKLSHVWQTLKAKKEIVCCLSRNNCESVCQNFGQKFNICTKRNKPKCHTESKPYIDFGCELHFNVFVNFILIWYLKKLYNTKKTGKMFQFFLQCKLIFIYKAALYKKFSWQ